jgi:hypothetical protein
MKDAKTIAHELIRARMRLKAIESQNTAMATEDAHITRAVETMELMALISALEQEAKDHVQTRAQEIYNEHKRIKDPEPTEESQLNLIEDPTVRQKPN